MIFAHGQKAGDIFYGLCAVRACGGGDLVLFNDPGLEPFDGPMTAKEAHSIASLARVQPYVRSVSIDRFDCPTSEMRGNPFNQFRRHLIDGRNIAEAHLAAMNQPHFRCTDRWLVADQSDHVAPVIFSRSLRYRNPLFPWGELYARYASDAVFIGTDDEHVDFERSISPIRRHICHDYLDIARALAGAWMFVGNQSAPAAIAEGLKVPNFVLEGCPDRNNCQFRRDGRVNVANTLLQYRRVDTLPKAMTYLTHQTTGGRDDG